MGKKEWKQWTLHTTQVNWSYVKLTEASSSQDKSSQVKSIVSVQIRFGRFQFKPKSVITRCAQA